MRIATVFLSLPFLLHVPAAATEADFPRPSPYPIAWEFDFEHDRPRRVVVEEPVTGVPQAYWYMTYFVTNNTDRERMFLPVFEMLTDEGLVIRSDRNIPPYVFRTIKAREGRQFLESSRQIAGELKVGEDQAREGVAIWREPAHDIRSFTIFIQGLSGETARIPREDDEEIILRKTLRLDYQVRGYPVDPDGGNIIRRSKEWIMR